MQQFRLFHESPPVIPGLRLLPDYVLEAEERALLEIIDAAPWDTEWRRRRQLYGVGYGAADRGQAPREIAPMPPWLAPLAQRLRGGGILHTLAENAVINEYLPGQGIALHRDYEPFGPTVVSLSLASCVVMDFTHPLEGRRSMDLPPRSLLVLGGDAREAWRHGIAARLADPVDGVRRPRERRVSVTLRCVRPG